VYFNEGDKITVLSRFANRLGIVDRVWGEMGHAGYSGDDERVTNHDCGEGPAPCYGHSAMFSAVPELMHWGPIVAKTLREKSNG
jgi:hypothetical protein